MKLDPTASLFDDVASWQNSPLEAFAAWLLNPAFVVTRQGVEQPLRDTSAQVYRFMGNKFIREVILPQPEEEGRAARPGRDWGNVTPEVIQEFLVGNDLKRGIRNRYVRLIERMYDHLAAKGMVSSNPARGLALKAPSKSNQAHEGTMCLSEAHQDAVRDKLPDGPG